jgi:hypothetical protein
MDVVISRKNLRVNTNVDHTRITMNFERFEKTQISAGTFKFVPKLADPSQTFTFLNFITAIV